jgi:simple sugar transport system ATP-binding protein
MKVADRVTVLRDGVRIGCFPAEELDSEKIEFYMTGTNFKYSAKAGEPVRQKPLLEVSGYSKKGNFSDVSFSVFPGEILGITGLLGSGRTEFALSLFGMNAPDSGTLSLDGKKVRIRSVRDAIRLGIAYVPENRLVQGLILQQSVAKNMVATIVDRFSRRGGFLDHRSEDRAIVEMVEEFKIKVPSLNSPVSTLSGGNQQKVVLAKWTAINPSLLILDGPTVGIDIAAKGAIHEFIKDLAGKGLGVIVISDEVPEVYNLSHRVIVMNKGVMMKEFITSSCDEAAIAEYMETIA